MTGKDLVRIIEENNLQDKRIMLTEVEEDNYGSIIFLLSDDDYPDVGVISLDEPYFDEYNEYETGKYWMREDLIESFPPTRKERL